MTDKTSKKPHKYLSDDMVNGITITIIIAVVVAGIIFWLTTL
ncbi:MAG: hypothetical protein ACHP9Y_02970 [Gammaproteobacteria bacterium]